MADAAVQTMVPVPPPTVPDMVEDFYRNMDLVLSNDETDWRGLTEAIMEQCSVGIIDSITVSCFDQKEVECTEEKEALFEAIGCALETSLAQSNLHIQKFHRLPLQLVKSVMKKCGRLNVLALGAEVSFDTTERDDMDDDVSCSSSTSVHSMHSDRSIFSDEYGAIETLRFDFSEDLVHIPNVFADHGINYENLEVRNYYSSSSGGPRVMATLRAHGKKFPSTTFYEAHQSSMLNSSTEPTQGTEQEDPDQELALPAKIIPHLSDLLKEPDDVVYKTKVKSLKSLSLHLASVPREQVLLDIAQVLSNDRTLTRFQVTWDNNNTTGRARGRGRSLSPSRTSSDRVRTIQAFEQMLESNMTMEELQIGLFNLGTKIPYLLDLNRGQKRIFLTRNYSDISRKEWIDALMHSLKRTQHAMPSSLDLSLNESGFIPEREAISLSFVYYFLRLNPSILEDES